MTPVPPPAARRVKILCSLGPATSSPDAIRDLVDAGMDTARLNLSHGTHEGHRAACERVRAAADAAGRAVGVMADLAGPKIRLGGFPAGPVRLAAGDEFVTGGAYQLGFTVGLDQEPLISTGGSYQIVQGYWSGGSAPTAVKLVAFDVESRGQALVVGRDFVDPDAAVVGADRVFPGADVGRQIGGGHPTPGGLDATQQYPFVKRKDGQSEIDSDCNLHGSCVCRGVDRSPSVCPGVPCVADR